MPSGLQGDACPSALAAVQAVIAPLKLFPLRIYIEPGPFECGDLWPGVGSPPICFGTIVVPGTLMHGWVSFSGSNKVAAIALSHPSLTSGGGLSSQPAWLATLRAFEVPPAGWAMP